MFSQELLEKAEQGDAQAQFELGNYLADGKGIVKDFDKGLDWLIKAAEQGHKDAETQLIALCYSECEYINKNLEKFFNFFSTMAKKGYPFSQFVLANYFYFAGNYTDKDLNEAIYWYTKAAEQGLEIAKKELNSLEQIEMLKITGKREEDDFSS